MTDWIEWNGGECPLSDGVEFKVRLRGLPEIGCWSIAGISGLTWWHNGDAGDIVAYKFKEVKTMEIGDKFVNNTQKSVMEIKGVSSNGCTVLIEKVDWGTHRTGEPIGSAWSVPASALDYHYTPYKEPKAFVGWVNVYDSGFGPRIHEYKWDAIRDARTGRLDTIKIEWTEGD